MSYLTYHLFPKETHREFIFLLYNFVYYSHLCGKLFIFEGDYSVSMEGQDDVYANFVNNYNFGGGGVANIQGCFKMKLCFQCLKMKLWQIENEITNLPAQINFF